MTTTIIVIAIALAAFLASRTKVVRGLNARRFMPFLYAAAAAYFGYRVYAGVAAETRVWPHVLLCALFLAGAIDSTKASGILGKS